MTQQETLEQTVLERLDGPHDDASVTDASAALAELVRLLNRTTRTAPVMAATVAAVMGDLAAATARLQQLLDQLDGWLDLSTEVPVYDDRGQDPTLTVEWARVAVRQARIHGAGLARELDTAHRHASHLGGGSVA